MLTYYHIHVNAILKANISWQSSVVLPVKHCEVNSTEYSWRDKFINCAYYSFNNMIVYGVSMTFPCVSTPTLFICEFIILWCFLFLVATSSNLVGEIDFYYSLVLYAWPCLLMYKQYYQNYVGVVCSKSQLIIRVIHPYILLKQRFIPKMTYSPGS